MSAAPARIQKPLLLPGIVPHLFQSRSAARHQRPNRMLTKNDSVAGPVLDHDAEHPRTRSDGSTAVAMAQDELEAQVRALTTGMDAQAREIATLRQQLQQLQNRGNWTYFILSTVGARLSNFWASLRGAVRLIIMWIIFIICTAAEENLNTAVSSSPSICRLKGYDSWRRRRLHFATLPPVPAGTDFGLQELGSNAAKVLGHFPYLINLSYRPLAHHFQLAYNMFVMYAGGWSPSSSSSAGAVLVGAVISVAVVGVDASEVPAAPRRKRYINQQRRRLDLEKGRERTPQTCVCGLRLRGQRDFADAVVLPLAAAIFSGSLRQSHLQHLLNFAVTSDLEISSASIKIKLPAALLFAKLMTVVEKKKKDSAPNASYCFARFSLISGPIYLTPDAFEKRLRGASEWTEWAISRRIPLQSARSWTPLKGNIEPNGLPLKSVESATSQPVNNEFTVHKGNFILAGVHRDYFTV
ncbi:hypothetical protein C8R45DRAFT_1136313 [Mycena sanguinolenta]|nr:hypothetical protein C8R45DRAFT_1136313 [Mycena sanguinolenta]